MNYKFTDPSTHLDFGFGVSASNFHDTANFMWENNPSRKTTGLLPNLYMYRHSIELYLKSLIVIIHKKLKIDYKDGEVSYNSNMPYVLVKQNEWKKITSCHYISALYRYFEQLIIEHEESLHKQASMKLSKIINPDNQRIVDHIKQYDDKSTYFRYSDLSNSDSNQNSRESEKHYNKKVEVQDLEEHIPMEKPSTFFVVVNPESGEPIEAHKSVKEMPLNKLAADLKSLTEYLSSIHAMFRMALCDGY
ncbi:hypothetical protein BpOF4_05620 [Alkalihalophilus pseudofirmus OF4]|uniref:Uncharacterized protein n=1 Tax=Alkalihalophilus pseudofirmus (strain ATCC BAA-2126 / JCM 17055 / OF4) TaxID=398511 RepID=D3FYG3_ALKPO|nr:hypothetical protein [Alkalihalophilus pseudofirmus]ADC49186.1 hypothetical protein BpOF4_05620 [Alkalihalophilus pseudofirmus OF4]